MGKRRGRRATEPPQERRLEDWLWDAACQIRGPLDAPKFKDYILPLIFLKRLSDVFDDEVARVAEEVGDKSTALSVIDGDHKLVRFYVPREGRWSVLRNPSSWESLPKPPATLGEALTDAVRAVARANPRLEGVIDPVDFNATAAGQPIVDNDRLRSLVDVLSQRRLGLSDVDPDLIGQAYEYLLRKFAEGQGQSAGEFYTPPEVARLMARMLDPQPGMSVYDPACGSGSLLIKCHLRLLETHGAEVNGHRQLPKDVSPLQLHGQEVNPSTYAIAKMNAVLHDMDADVALGDTMRRPAFTTPSGKMRQFDLVTANPMWNQDVADTLYRTDPHERFGFGAPPSSSADWGWVQHMLSSLAPSGRMAVVLDSGAASRGSGNAGANRERDIRKAFLEQDLIEAVVQLPENLFYNTSAPGTIMVLNRQKRHSGELLLVNATDFFTKDRPKNILGDDHIVRITDACRAWRPETGLSAVVTIAQVAENDYDLSPGRYVVEIAGEASVSLDEAVRLLRDLEVDYARASHERWKVLAELGERLSADAAGGPSRRRDRTVKLADLVQEIQSGDWGQPSPSDGHVECRVLRATDFARLERGDLSRVPVRYLRARSASDRQLLPDDLVVELSGGSAAQPTGRLIRIGMRYEQTLTFSNFLKRLRLTDEVDPTYFDYCWRYLYAIGRTRPYEKRTTGIRNFKLADFLDSESISLPSLDEQKRIAHILATIRRASQVEREGLDASEVLSSSAMQALLGPAL